MNTLNYRRAFRRLVVDMHIPDWDNAFLSEFDPERMAALYVQAKAQGVMFYCHSHVGLCYWPSKTGKMHAGLGGRDMVREALDALHAHGLAACGYYSGIFNNWAAIAHPEWRIARQGVGGGEGYNTTRYGVCCPNNPEYRAFALEQIQELVSTYEFDAFFVDMTFWPGVCFCPHCQDACRKAIGVDIPSKVDWFDPRWCAFDALRREWMLDYGRTVKQSVKVLKPDLTFYQNYACAFHGWAVACPFEAAVNSDFLGADFYGDPIEQLVNIKAMNNLTETRPPEFFTSRCVNLQDHVRTKSDVLMETQAFAATLFSSSFALIDAIDVRGTVNPAVYERMGRIFEMTKPYEPYYGGDPVEDIAVYFSDDSQMDFGDNGIPSGIEWTKTISARRPHVEAVRGVSRVLQQAHVPFGVVSRRRLDALGQYRALVLPNVLRMNDEEVQAVRNYVERGGRVLASGYTSLTHTSSGRTSDFMLADVFGCHFIHEAPARVTYVKPRRRDLIALIAPQDYISDTAPTWIEVTADRGATLLATTTRPYGHPHAGSLLDHNWASIHSYPPWDDTDAPAIVHQRFGRGEALYCSAVLEATDCEANNKLLLGLLRGLIDKPLRYGADTYPAVWMNATYQPDQNRLLVGFLNYQSLLPSVPVARIPFWVRAPEGRIFKSLVVLPDRTPVEFVTDSEGTLFGECRDLNVFQMLMAELAA